MPDPKDHLGRHSNSLYHWRPFLQKQYPNKIKDMEQIILLCSYGIPGGISQEEFEQESGQNVILTLQKEKEEAINTGSQDHITR